MDCILKKENCESQVEKMQEEKAWIVERQFMISSWRMKYSRILPIRYFCTKQTWLCFFSLPSRLGFRRLFSFSKIEIHIERPKIRHI